MLRKFFTGSDISGYLCRAAGRRAGVRGRVRLAGHAHAAERLPAERGPHAAAAASAGAADAAGPPGPLHALPKGPLSSLARPCITLAGTCWACEWHTAADTAIALRGFSHMPLQALSWPVRTPAGSTANHLACCATKFTLSLSLTMGAWDLCMPFSLVRTNWQ